MPHSESQVLTDIVNGNITSIAPVKEKPLGVLLDLNSTNGTKKINMINEKLAPSRPPLPPNAPAKLQKSKLPVKKPSLLSQQTITALSLLSTNNRPEIRSSNYRCQLEKDYIKPLDVSLKLPISRSATPTDFETNHLLSLSRTSSLRSIDGSIRSFSPISVLSNTSGLSSFSSTTTRSLTSPNRSLTPRRIFPQTYSPNTSINLDELNSLEQSPTVFDGKLSFVLGCNRQRVRQEFRPLPAHAADIDTASRYLSDKIQNFLKRTDHVTEEWQACCKSGAKQIDNVVSEIEDRRRGEDALTNDKSRLGRSKSVTNIMIKGYQMAKNMPPTERSHSMSRDGSLQRSRAATPNENHLRNGSITDDDDDTTIVEDFEEVCLQYGGFFFIYLFPTKNTA